MRISSFALSFSLRRRSLRPPRSPNPRRCGAGIHAHRHRGKERAARRLSRQVHRARVDQSRMSVRAQALHERQHAGPAEGMGRARGRLAVDQLDEHQQLGVQDTGRDGAVDALAGRGAEGDADRRHSATGRAYAARATPHMFVIDPAGNVCTTARSTIAAGQTRPMPRPRTITSRRADRGDVRQTCDGRVDFPLRLQHQVLERLAGYFEIEIACRGYRASSARRILSAVAGCEPR